jgi:hypothetical protein
MTEPQTPTNWAAIFWPLVFSGEQVTYLGPDDQHLGVVPFGICVTNVQLTEGKASCRVLPRELGLFRAQIPGVGFACHRPCQAVIGAVTRFGILLAGAACFTALHGALGDRPPAHRFR